MRSKLARWVSMFCVGPQGRVAVVLDGGVFRRQPEGVPAHGVQHVEAAHLGVAGHHVADRCSCSHAPCGCRPTGTGTSRARTSWAWHVFFRDLVQVGIFPGLLPTRFDLVRVVLFHRPSSLADAVIHIGFIVAAPRFHKGKKRQHPRQGKPSGFLGNLVRLSCRHCGFDAGKRQAAQAARPACGAQPRFTPDCANRSRTARLSGLHALPCSPNPARRGLD